MKHLYIYLYIHVYIHKYIYMYICILKTILKHASRQDLQAVPPNKVSRQSLQARPPSRGLQAGSPGKVYYILYIIYSVNIRYFPLINIAKYPGWHLQSLLPVMCPAKVLIGPAEDCRAVPALRWWSSLSSLTLTVVTAESWERLKTAESCQILPA